MISGQACLNEVRAVSLWRTLFISRCKINSVEYTWTFPNVKHGKQDLEHGWHQKWCQLPCNHAAVQAATQEALYPGPQQNRTCGMQHKPADAMSHWPRQGVTLSSLGMNMNGDVRTASEFKDVFEDTASSYGPYRCPFCEVAYEDRCILTLCVVAPHFKLPRGITHRNGCNGEVGEDALGEVKVTRKAPERSVVGRIELPEALVKRRSASLVRRPDDNGVGPLPDAVEVARRRRQIALDATIPSCYTTSQLRAIIYAYKRLKMHADEEAVAANHRRGSVTYNKSFRATLTAHVLSLYSHKMTYGNAFQGSKLQPWHFARVYHGSGFVREEGDYLVIRDVDSWPMLPQVAKGLAPFEIKIYGSLVPEAPTSHLRALEELVRIARAGHGVDWYAYGLPVIQGEGFELRVDSLDHLYWTGQHQR